VNILALLTDAYGSRGGIAQHNRLLLESLCTAPGVETVTALPRIISEPVGALPSGLKFEVESARGKLPYVRTLARMALRRPSTYRLVVCGHLNLLPLAAAAAARQRARLLLITHGIEAWAPRRGYRLWMRRVDAVVAVSEFTRRRVLAWAGIPASRALVIPNAIDLSRYSPAPRSSHLQKKYGLTEKKVILTLGRLASSERYKGHDEILEVLPELIADVPDVVYLIVGEGDDRPRLEAKARALGVAERVVFAGYVSEAEKLDHYRLADVFAMPGRGEGFGIVYLEALACGIPVIASTADASREAVCNGALGDVVDPQDRVALRRLLAERLTHPVVPSAPTFFAVDRFRERWHRALECFAPQSEQAPASRQGFHRSVPVGARDVGEHARVS
jgi:phosphatidyl-myo-inositol dimannoside synthase